MGTKHKKREWIYNQTYQTITDSEGYGIAQQNGIRNEKEWEANAKLIAASPLMYEYINEMAKNGCKKAKKILSKLN